MNNKTTLLIIFVLLPLAKAQMMELNLSMDGDLDYQSRVINGDMEDYVNVEARDGHIDLRYWFDYETPELQINQYPVYNFPVEEVRSSDTKAILTTTGDQLLIFAGLKQDVYPNKYEKYFNSTLAVFTEHLLVKVQSLFMMPVYQELEYYKRKVAFMEKDLNDIRLELSQIHGWYITSPQDTGSYDCRALKSMMADGLIEKGSCDNETWTADKGFVVKFNS